MYETKQRTVVKMVTFKVATIMNSLVWTAIFGLPFWTALPAALCMNLTGMALYYVKERIWNRIKWGRQHENGNNQGL
jgi:uncharacterized membrane protein